jgi:CRP-like cAMP-binding protein
MAAVRVDAHVTLTSNPTIAPRNYLLLHLPGTVRELLLAEAEFRVLQVGETFARVGDPISWAFFPDTGVISAVSEMKTGHQLAVSTTGPEGLIGFGPVLGVLRYPQRLVVLVESEGYCISSERLHRAFDDSAALRRIVLTYVARKMSELVTLAACARAHSHRQRLARWLLVIADKAGQLSLPLTHERVAQMVGGPRHAVTVALNELRAKGAITHLRGRIDIIDRAVLIGEACECYEAPRAR